MESVRTVLHWHAQLEKVQLYTIPVVEKKVHTRSGMRESIEAVELLIVREQRGLSFAGKR